MAEESSKSSINIGKFIRYGISFALVLLLVFIGISVYTALNNTTYVEERSECDTEQCFVIEGYYSDDGWANWEIWRGIPIGFSITAENVDFDNDQDVFIICDTKENSMSTLDRGIYMLEKNNFKECVIIER